MRSRARSSPLKETLPGNRLLVLGRTDEERVVEIAGALADEKLRAGDSLLLETKSGHVLEKLPKPEVEELILEEVPDISYEDIGGLEDQIEEIKDAVELPYLHGDLFREHELSPPKGILLYGPPGLREDTRCEGRRELSRKEGCRAIRT